MWAKSTTKLDGGGGGVGLGGVYWENIMTDFKKNIDSKFRRMQNDHFDCMVVSNT